MVKFDHHFSPLYTIIPDVSATCMLVCRRMLCASYISYIIYMHIHIEACVNILCCCLVCLNICIHYFTDIAVLVSNCAEEIPRRSASAGISVLVIQSCSYPGIYALYKVTLGEMIFPFPMCHRQELVVNIIL